MLNVYAADWCPQCKKTIDYLKKNYIPFKYIDIENAPDEIVKKVIEVNGGDDWVVPTLEFKGQWRKGKFFNEVNLTADLKKKWVLYSVKLILRLPCLTNFNF